MKRPEWFKFERVRAYRPQINREPSKRRQQVLERLLRGWPYKRIAADMGISRGTVDTHAQAIYAQHRVHGRGELVALLGAKPEVPLTHWRDRPAMAKRAHACLAARGT